MGRRGQENVCAFSCIMLRSTVCGCPPPLSDQMSAPAPTTVKFPIHLLSNAFCTSRHCCPDWLAMLLGVVKRLSSNFIISFAFISWDSSMNNLLLSTFWLPWYLVVMERQDKGLILFQSLPILRIMSSGWPSNLWRWLIYFLVLLWTH